MDLGKYTFYILTSYGAALILIIGLVLVSIITQKRIRKKIKDLENMK